jgi:hypothetical protein
MVEMPAQHPQSDAPQASTIAQSPKETIRFGELGAARAELEMRLKESRSTGHSPEPWSLHSAQIPIALFEVHAGEEIVALILSDEDKPIRPRELADAALITAAPRLLRVLRQLFDCMLIPLDSKVPIAGQVEAIKTSSELLADLQKAGVF